jgi:hypothetical protein
LKRRSLSLLALLSAPATTGACAGLLGPDSIQFSGADASVDAPAGDGSHDDGGVADAGSRKSER